VKAAYIVNHVIGQNIPVIESTGVNRAAFTTLKPGGKASAVEAAQATQTSNGTALCKLFQADHTYKEGQ
jgi:hypothetical protein